MTRIQTVKIEGLRARDQELTLSPLTLLQGKMGCGKTSVADALRILFLGNVPNIGKDSTAVGRLMRNGLIRIEGTLDDGSTAVRGYRREGDALEQFANYSRLDPKAGVREVGNAIRGLVGREDRDAAEHLDLRQFFNCTPAERKRRIEELLEASGMAADEISTRVRALAFLRAAGIKEDQFPEDLSKLTDAATGARNLLDDGLALSLDKALDDFDREVLGGGLVRAIEVARQRKNDAADEMKRRRNARAEIEDRVTALRAPTDAIEDLDKRRDEALAAIAAGEKELEQAEARTNARSSAEAAITPLKQALASSTERISEAKDRLPKAEEAEREAATIVDPPEIDAPPMTVVGADVKEQANGMLADAAAMEDEAEALVASANGIDLPEEISIANDEASHRIASQVLEQAEKSPWREVERIADQINQQPHTAELRTLAAEHGGEIEALRTAATKAEDELQQATERRNSRAAQIADTIGKVGQLREQSKEKLDEARKIATAARKLVTDTQDAVDSKNKEARLEYAKAVADREAILDENKSRREALAKTSSDIRQAVTTATAQLDKVTSDLRAAEERLRGVDAVPPKNPAEIKSAIDRATVERDELDEKIKAVRGAAELRGEMRTLMRQIDEAMHTEKAWKAIEWSGRGVHELDLVSRAGGLQERMRTYLRAAGRDEEPYLRASKGSCDFGWRRGEQEISVEALSGGETVIFCATLAAAIIAIRKPEIRILLVEAAEVGLGAGGLFQACTAMVESGDVDQVIVASCTPVEAPDEWTTIDIEAGSRMPEAQAVAS